MEEPPINHPGVQEDQYHTLGRKTLAIFVFQRIHAAFIFLLITIGLFAVIGQPFLKISTLDLTPYVTLSAWIALLVFVVVFGLTFLIAWFTYINYKFMLGDDSLKIKRGILNKEEVAIPYRQIQNADIERDLSFQMFGVSRIVILTAGQEEEKSGSDQTEGILPALDKDLAEWLQAELLKRANIQKVREVPA
jgi:uncharacterized membrane protein YdbT with pleckstrin-like domain